MTDFHEVQFPTSISRGSLGGPRRRTDIVTLRSGYEERNSVWAGSRREYDAGLGLRDINDVYDALAFFEARLGRLYGFRWKDWSDYRSGPPNQGLTSNDQIIGIGDGLARVFGLSKTYTSGPSSVVRRITKPILETVIVAVDGVETTDFLLDPETGEIFLPSAPEVGVLVTAGFEFDVPVRFTQDQLDIAVETFNAGAVPQLGVIEVRVTEENGLTSLYNMGMLDYDYLSVSLQEIVAAYTLTMENY